MPTLALLRDNRFPNRPPRWIRARLFRYRFSTPAERRTTGAWWVRRPEGEFLRPIALRASGSASELAPPGGTVAS